MCIILVLYNVVYRKVYETISYKIGLYVFLKYSTKSVPKNSLKPWTKILFISHSKNLIQIMSVNNIFGRKYY